ncbi:general stress protein [Methylophilus flavus]|uniref:General stress protein n=1 Tax=Methylophilus flavus TaxID=640084 RepID=A0ABW3P9M8_9PROT
MTKIHCVTVGVFANHDNAETAVKDLERAGYNMKKLSIIGRGYHSEENVVGYYNVGARMAHWGKNGLFWGWVWGVVFGSAFFFIPGIGPVIAGGPIVSWLLGALESAAIVGGLSTLGGALAGIGIPKDSVLMYETAIKTDKFVLLLHGKYEDAEKAKSILIRNNAENTDSHEFLSKTYAH